MNTAQTRAIGLHLSTFVSGMVATVTVVAASGVDIQAAWDHLHNAAKDLLAAWAIVAPALAGGYAAYKNSTSNKLKDAIIAADAVEAAREIEPTPRVAAVATALGQDPRNG